MVGDISQFHIYGGVPQKLCVFFNRYQGVPSMVDIIFSIGCVVDKIHNHLLDMNLYKLCDERSVQGLFSLVVWKQLAES